MFSRFRRRRVKWLPLLGISNETRESLTAWRYVGLGCLLVSAIVLNTLSNVAANQDPYASDSFGASRKLFAANDSSEESFHGPEWENCEFEKSTSKGAWIFSHAICVLIIFIALAIVCDDFFVPSLELISEKLQLSEDVAGATFMAAGSSAPELFTSVAGVIVETDVGVGTIVGSAVFNLLIIIALTAALAGQELHLDWRPLMRDAFFYAMSIGCFIGFAWDGYFVHYEAVVLLILYTAYIVLMVFNPRLMDWMGSWRQCCGSKVEPSDEEDVKDADPEKGGKEADDRKFSLSGGHAKRLQIHKSSLSHDLQTPDKHIFHHHRGSVAGVLGAGGLLHHSSQHNGLRKGSTVSDTIREEKEGDTKEDDKGSEAGSDDEEEKTIQMCPCLPCCCPVRTWPPDSTEAREEGGAVAWAKLIIRWVLFIPSFPFVALYSWTIPDCSKEELKKYYLVSFLMSVFWIAVLSFGMVTLVGRTGCILNIDTYIMGLVIIAIGTSIPDALSSVLVARDGYGDMAVSNAIGSNVFDINLGLGLPFIIRIAIDVGEPISLLQGEEWAHFYSGHMPIIPHAKFGFILLIILAIALTIFFVFKFRLIKAIGIAFVCMYVLFLAYAFTQELYCVRKQGIYC